MLPVVVSIDLRPYFRFARIKKHVCVQKRDPYIKGGEMDYFFAAAVRLRIFASIEAASV